MLVYAAYSALQVSMVTVAQFIDSIEHLTAGSKAALKRHVQMDVFGAKLDADCNELFKEALQENLPATFNALERTAVKQTLKHPGEFLNRTLWFFVVILCASLAARHTEVSSTHLFCADLPCLDLGFRNVCWQRRSILLHSLQMLLPSGCLRKYSKHNVSACAFLSSKIMHVASVVLEGAC